MQDAKNRREDSKAKTPQKDTDVSPQIKQHIKSQEDINLEKKIDNSQVI